MKYIYLRGSDLAKLTGHNKFDTLEKTVNELLSRNGIAERYVPKSNIEEKLMALTEEQVTALKTELNISKDATIAEVESVIKSTVMGNSYSGALSEGESKQKVDEKIEGKPILQSLEGGIKQDLQMRRGNIKENKNLNTIQTNKGIAIQQRNSKMYTKEIHRSDTYCLMVRGKVDGVSGGTIIESKNRTRCLFNELRDYERVQLECYMFLTGLDDALLTEHFNEESNCIPYSHDEEFWAECLTSIIQFIDTHIAGYLKDS
tara:strand:+ start:593 stop:1372 length:780 start_codon:yes stop_codon:yes gene_type:complete